MSNPYNVKPVWGSSKPSLRDCNWESGPDRKLAHNTHRETSYDDTLAGPSPAVRYHGTIIIRRVSNGYRLSSGGWQTSTTKQRLNALMPAGYSIFQKDYRWFITLQDGETVPFEDGMVISG